MASETPKNKNEYLNQLEELSKLTGTLAHEIKNPLSTIKINLKLISEDLESSNSDRVQVKSVPRLMTKGLQGH